MPKKIYNHEVVMTRFSDFDQIFINVEFEDRHDAEIHRNEFECIQGYEITYNKVFPIVECHCGEKVRCMEFTNTCDCGADYNFEGSLLVPRSQWGEETGERWQDCY